MTRSRRFLVAVASLGLVVTSVLVAPARAEADSGLLTPSASADSGTDRICVGIPAPDGVNKIWVCTPEEQWYAAVIAVVLSMNPA